MRRPPAALLLVLPVALWAAGCAGSRPAERPAPPTGTPEPVAVAEPAEPTPEPPPQDVAPPPVEAPDEALEHEIATEEIPVRVGLVSDLARYELPCCDGRIHVQVDGSPMALSGPLTVVPASRSVTPPVHRLQAAALRDEGEAERLATDLARRTGWPADVGFDAESGLYRVRLGRFDQRSAADDARRRVAGLGLGGVWVTQEAARLDEPALRIVRSGEPALTVAGRWLAVQPGDGIESLPVLLDDGLSRFRGALLLYVNDRGTLNLVNELPLEQYLRGVVPRELGPELYPRIEALKAQAVAARTYTLHHLGEFSAEGYDICKGPRCQVYGGRTAEHPLSDRAVEETAGQVILHHDSLIDSMYSANCGGHTEDAPVVFPWMDAPYLQGVPCPEASPVRLVAADADGAPYPRALTRRLLPEPTSPGSLRDDLQERLRELARQAGLAPPGDRLGSLERTEVRRYVRSLFDLVLDPDLLVDGTSPRGDASTLAPAAAPRPATPDTAVTETEAEWLLVRLAEQIGLLRSEEAYFLRLDATGRRLTVAEAEARRQGLSASREIDLPSELVTLASRGGHLQAGTLELVPGDRLVLHRWRGQVVAVSHGEDTAALPVDRNASLHTWRRVKTDRELAERVSRRYPGFRLERLEVLSRGISGRVGKLRLVDRSGRTELVEGLAVRWVLDLPDTRFEMRRLSGAWEFVGGGWGHGVGLCQIGAFRMAGRGATYREILGHYYSGVRLGRAVVRRPATRPSN